MIWLVHLAFDIEDEDEGEIGICLLREKENHLIYSLVRKSYRALDR